ncbi:MAG: hypothetical protein WAT66_04765 [Actinomycetota bacterium]
MGDWSVRINVTGGDASEDQLDDLMDALEPFAAIVTGPTEEGTFGVRLSVEADNLIAAIRDALAIVEKNLELANISSTRVDAEDAAPMTQIVAENRGETGETLVGLSDVARKHGFSRQRAFELSQLPGFPHPIATVGAGRVWRYVDVESFLAKPRAAGRPRKTAGELMASIEVAQKIAGKALDAAARQIPATGSVSGGELRAVKSGRLGDSAGARKRLTVVARKKGRGTDAPKPRSR